MSALPCTGPHGGRATIPGRRNISYRVRMSLVACDPRIASVLASPRNRRNIKVLPPKRTWLVDDRRMRQRGWASSYAVLSNIHT